MSQAGDISIGHRHLPVNDGLLPPPPPPPASLPQPLNRRRKRLKIDVACDRCRVRKVKCDGVRPACGNCSRKLDLRNQCRYGTNSSIASHDGANSVPPPRNHQSPHRPMNGDDGSRATDPTVQRSGVWPPSQQQQQQQQQQSVQRPPHRPIAAKPPSSSFGPSPQISTPPKMTPSHTSHAAAVDSMTAVGDEPTAEFFGSSSAGSFTAQIKAAVDARLGQSPSDLPPGTNPMNPTRVPPKIQSRRRHDPGNILLPTRRLADELMRTYWLYIDPLYPFLDKKDWQDRYGRLFAGQPLNTDESIFMASLNIVFALSTQLHEGQDATVRNDTSQDYFLRAQDLVDVTVWDPGSLETVQYLLITSQYLQSTNSPHQTWMVVGLAVRTAQSLGLHRPETAAAQPTALEKELLRKLWHGCVLMDRMVALTHGRPAMISTELASSVPLPVFQKNGAPIPDDSTDVAFFVKSAELYEITHKLVETLYSAKTSRMKQTQRAVNDLSTIIQIDNDMNEWEQDLPDQLQLHNLGTIAARPSIILRLRFLHTRILLLRPILSLVCLSQAASEPETERLSNRLHKQCALECVATARATIRIFFDHQVTDGTVGLLPAWWYRLYYLFSASTVLIAAKLRPDVFPPDGINQSWTQAVHVFETLQKVSLSAQKCVTALRLLSAKILSTVLGPSSQMNNAAKPEQESFVSPRMGQDTMSNFNHQKLLDDFELNFNDAQFNAEKEDYAWLNEITSWNFLSA